MSSKALVVVEAQPAASAAWGERLIGALGSMIARLVLAGIEHRLKRKTYLALSALDNRMLADIGLDRSEISSVIHDRTRERMRARFSMY